VHPITKILILGGTIFARNRGVSAIVNGCVNSVRKNMANPEVALIHTYVESFHPIKTTNLENIRIVMDDKRKLIPIFKNAFIRTFLATVWRLLSYLHIDAELLLRDKVLNEYKRTDVVINLSYGDMFAYKNDFYSKFLFFILAHQCMLAILLKKPLFFFPQSIGPFFGKFSPFLASFILNRCNIIMVRDEISRDLVKRKTVAPIQLVPDMSFILEPAPDSRVSEIFSQENVEIKRPLVGFALRDNLYKHLDVISEVVDYLSTKMNASVVFIPHFSSSDVNYFFDPRFIAKALLKKVKVKRQSTVIEGEYTTEELRGLIGKCDLFVGAYMHANMSALSMHVPTIALSYSHKTEGIMNMVGLGDFVLSVDDLDAATLIKKIEKAYHDRVRIKENLNETIPVLQKKTMQAGELVKKSIESDV